MAINVPSLSKWPIIINSEYSLKKTLPISPEYSTSNLFCEIVSLSLTLKFADKPSGSTWLALYGVSILTGIGFTMSLFVGNLAFVNNLEYMDGVKIGVLTGSLLSTLFGYFLLLFSSKK